MHLATRQGTFGIINFNLLLSKAVNYSCCELHLNLIHHQTMLLATGQIWDPQATTEVLVH